MEVSSENDRARTLSLIGKALRERNLCLFIGAGLSRYSGIYDWKGLMQGASDCLGLDVEKEWYDLASLAQYYFEVDPTNRDVLISELRTKSQGAVPSKFHRLICNWPVDNIWTTNYDTLIEDAYKEYLPNDKRNVISTNTEVSNSTQKWKFNIYKMHGSISNNSSDIIISSYDYDMYPDRHMGFLHELKSQLMSKTFLFIGFSFNDPNIQYVMRSLNKIVLNRPRAHHMFMLDLQKNDGELAEDYEYRRRKEAYRIKNLREKKIRTTILKNVDDLYKFLSECLLRSVKDRVVLCGSDDTSEFCELSETLGYSLVSNDYQLYTCFAEGVGRLAVTGAMKYFGESDTDKPYKKLRIWPTNQYNKANSKDKEKYRRNMVTEAGCCIIIGGKKGTFSEYKSAVRVGRLCIPIGYTGGTARKIYKNVVKDFDLISSDYKFEPKDKKEILEILKYLYRDRSVEETISSVLKILQIVGKI